MPAWGLGFLAFLPLHSPIVFLVAGLADAKQNRSLLPSLHLQCTTNRSELLFAFDLVLCCCLMLKCSICMTFHVEPMGLGAAARLHKLKRSHCELVYGVNVL